MKLNKKQNSKTKRETTGEATARGFEFGAIAVATAIIVAIPVVLDLNMILSAPNAAYHSPKFEMLMGFSAVLLVTVLGFLILRKKALGVPVLVPALTLLGISALSTLFSEDPWHSLFGDRNEGLLSLGAGTLLFYALARGLSSPLRVRVFLAAGATTAVLVALFGISQKYGLDMISGWGNRWYRDLGEPFSTIGNSLTLAAYLTLMMGAATALCFKAGSSWRYRVPWLFALAVIGVCWIYTDSRGAMLGAIVALPIILSLAQRTMGTVQPLLLPLAALVSAMAAAIAASVAFGNSTFSSLTLAMLVAYLAFIGVILWLSRRGVRAVQLFLVTLAVLVGIAAVALTVSGNLALPDRLASGLTVDKSSQIRLYIWRDTVSMILDRPLLGYGPDNFAGPFSSYMEEDLTAAITNARDGVQKVDRAHNDLLQVAATTGILGLAAYTWVLISYFRNVYRRGGWPLIALSGGVLVYVFEIQTAFPTIATSVAFWGLLGTSVAVMRIQDRESHNPETPSETGSIKEALTAGRSRARVYEPLVVVIVVAVLAAIGIPTFLSQRAEAAEIQQARVMVNVRKTVSAYEQVRAQSGIYPQDGVYTRTRPIVGTDSSLVFLPSTGVRITTDTTPTGDFTVEGEATSLSGTFRYSYDSATGTYDASP